MNGISLKGVLFDTCLTILKENVVPNSTINIEVQKCDQDMHNDIPQEVSTQMWNISEQPPAEAEYFEGQQLSTSTMRNISEIPELAETEPLSRADDVVFNDEENGKLFHPQGQIPFFNNVIL